MAIERKRGIKGLFHGIHDSYSATMIRNELKAEHLSRIDEVYITFKYALACTVTDRRIDEIFDAIAHVRNLPWHHILYALDIKGIGEYQARKIAMSYSAYDLLQVALSLNLQEEAQAHIHGKAADSIWKWFKAYENTAIINRLSKQLYNLKSHSEDIDLYKQGRVQGKTFCMTGTFTEDKAFFVECIYANAGNWLRSIPKRDPKAKINYLVVGKETASQTKIDKALAAGIQILTEAELREMLEI